MRDDRVGDSFRVIGGGFRWREFVQTGLGATARLSAVPLACFVGVEAGISAVFGQCQDFGGVPSPSGIWRISLGFLARSSRRHRYAPAS